MPRRTSIESCLLIHGVFAVEGKHVFFPDLVVLLRVRHCLDEHDLRAVGPLLVLGSVVAVDLQCKVGEVAHHEVEDLVDDVRVHVVELGLLKDELAIDYDGEHLAKRQGEGGVHVLHLVRAGLLQHLFEDLDLLDEGRHIGQALVGLEHGLVVVELDLAQALGGTLVEQERIVVQ